MLRNIARLLGFRDYHIEITYVYTDPNFEADRLQISSTVFAWCGTCAARRLQKQSARDLSGWRQRMVVVTRI
jgi:hypothetical protein